MNSHKSPFYLLRQIAELERQDIGTLLAYGIGIGLMSLATPVAVGALVNTIAFGALFQPLLVLTLVLFVLLSFSNAMAALQFYVVEMMQRRLFVRFFHASTQHLQHATAEKYRQSYLPETANRFLEVAALQKTASVLLMETTGYILQTLIGMVLLAFYHPVLLAFDLFLVTSILLILLVWSRKGAESAIEHSSAKYAAMAWLESVSTNLVLGRANSEQQFFQAKTDSLILNYLNTSKNHFSVLFQQNIGALVLHTLANTLLLGIGGWLVIERQLSLGQLIAAELVVSALVYGLTRLGKTLENYYGMLASLNKLGYILDLPQERQDGSQLEVAEGPYQINMHGFSLPDSPLVDGLKKVDIEISAGDKLVITEGAVHGSLLDVLYGFRNPASGFVSIQQQDMRDLNLGLLRDNIRLVRKAEPYAESVMDNLCVGKELDFPFVSKTLEQLGLLEAIVALPEGLKCRLNIDGSPLTDEQCLRLTLARALLGKPRLLLIDGILDNLAGCFLPQILDLLFAADAPWTLVVTSQDANVISRCQRRVRIVDGVWQEDI